MNTDGQRTKVGRHSALPDYVKLRRLPRADGDGPLLTLDEMSRRYIGYVLRAVDGDRMKAAEILGISLTTLGRRMK